MKDSNLAGVNDAQVVELRIVQVLEKTFLVVQHYTNILQLSKRDIVQIESIYMTNRLP